jgi:RimJ/RimL family protein N-acetyltransferase
MPNFQNIQLSTPRLTLRPLRKSDAEAMYAIRSTIAGTRYSASEPWTSMDKAHEWLARVVGDIENNANVGLALERIEDKTMIGSCSLFHMDEQCRRTEIGYDLNPAYWKKGYMNEALQALLRFGFTELNLNRIEADIHPDNIDSAKTLERLGFIKEGHLRERWIVGDEVSGSLIYGLLLSDWKA